MQSIKSLIRTMIHDKHSDSSEKMKICRDYVKALEEERRKVLVFRSELPLCLDLVTQAIEACKKQQLSGTATDYHSHGQSKSSEQTSDEPILEQFIPIEKLGSLERSDHRGENPKDEGRCCNRDNKCNTPNKSDWLRSVQLWNQTPDPAPIQLLGSPEKIDDGKEVSCHPRAKEKINLNTQPPLLPASTSSTAETGGRENNTNKKEGKVSTLKKERRCWSPELHRRFLQALQQLGGSRATPKQIRELMKVDGLTNDEVKSHLQKYRLHTRRPASSSVSISNPTTTTPTPQPPQFVVVGGIWVPPEYSLVAKSGDSVAAHDGIYATIPSILPGNYRESSESPKLLRKSSASHSNGCNNKRACSSQSDSPGTSSSTHTTTSAY